MSSTQSKIVGGVVIGCDLVAKLKIAKTFSPGIQKIDDLPVLASWSGTLAMLSSKFNGPVAHGSTR